MNPSLKEQYKKIIDEHKGLIEEISHTIHSFREVGFEEVKSSEYLTGLLEQHGFKVERGAGGMPTAFRAEYEFQEGGPCLGLMAEYDALPGMGHACGHNLISCGAVGAAITLSKLGKNIRGKLVLMGTPAEEGGGGKLILTDKGYFDDIDAIVYFHPSAVDDLYGPTLACRWYELTYTGVPAHVQVNPQGGKNALTAMAKAVLEIDRLTDNTEKIFRIGSTIKDGGLNPFIVPGKACADFLLSAGNDNDLSILDSKFHEITERIAQESGCEPSYKKTMDYSSVQLNYSLTGVIKKVMTDMGLKPEKPSLLMTSTDCGGPSVTCPFAGFRLDLGEGKFFPHSPQFEQLAGSDRGTMIGIQAATIEGMSLLEIYDNPSLLLPAKAEFEETIK